MMEPDTKRIPPKILYWTNELMLVTTYQLARAINVSPKLIARHLIVKPRKTGKKPSELIRSRQVFPLQRGSTDDHVFATYPIKDRSEIKLEHDLTITDVHIILAKTPYLLYWEQTFENKHKKSKANEDAFCILQNPHKPPPNKYHYYLEIDMGTESHLQIKSKLERYVEHPDKPFRVLFITPLKGRAKNLAELANSIVPENARKFYYFIDLPSFLIDPVGLDVAGYSILPKLVK